MNGGRRCGKPIAFRPVALTGVVTQTYPLYIPDYAFATTSEVSKGLLVLI